MRDSKEKVKKIRVKGKTFLGDQGNRLRQRDKS